MEEGGLPIARNGSRRMTGSAADRFSDVRSNGGVLGQTPRKVGELFKGFLCSHNLSGSVIDQCLD